MDVSQEAREKGHHGASLAKTMRCNARVAYSSGQPQRSKGQRSIGHAQFLSGANTRTCTVARICAKSAAVR